MRLSLAVAAATFHGFSLRHPAMMNQELIDNGNRTMDEADQAIDRSKKVVHDTVNVGIDTAAALKAQTEQMSGIINELDAIHFSIKKASKLVKEIDATSFKYVMICLHIDIGAYVDIKTNYDI
ncbi:novel plant SNARE 11-like isoform X2 [Camellia sinensis]|uniref:novel plant SNARE 11-like isoform X2 n=1 Tax=Camellia sinensis TaxID=4442 RepID=UPI001035C3F0|nr:novel plant SNARE 11-like isoform X2 [Camellia sinensis]